MLTYHIKHINYASYFARLSIDNRHARNLVFAKDLDGLLYRFIREDGDNFLVFDKFHNVSVVQQGVDGVFHVAGVVCNCESGSFLSTRAVSICSPTFVLTEQESPSSIGFPSFCTRKPLRFSFSRSFLLISHIKTEKRKRTHEEGEDIHVQKSVALLLLREENNRFKTTSSLCYRQVPGFRSR